MGNMFVKKLGHRHNYQHSVSLIKICSKLWSDIHIDHLSCLTGPHKEITLLTFRS